MPAVTQKIVKRRIKSIANTMKITKAMELVSAAKMRKAVQGALSTRPFATLSWATITALSQVVGGAKHPLLEENISATKKLLIVFTADRGLAGGFNANIIKATMKWVGAVGTDPGISSIDVIAIGRRGADALTRRGLNVISRFEGLTNKPTFADLLPIGRQILESYLKKDYREVHIGYTDYISGLIQKPRIYKLLPFSKPDVIGEESTGQIKDQPLRHGSTEYLFEPDPQAVLNRVLPRLVETMLYQALLESAASEHSARMLAMRSASDAAKDMLSDLKFTYNQIRQSTITREIAEISSGKAALE